MPSYTIEFENSKYDIGHKHLVTSTKNLRQIYLAAHTPFVVCLTNHIAKNKKRGSAWRHILRRCCKVHFYLSDTQHTTQYLITVFNNVFIPKKI